MSETERQFSFTLLGQEYSVFTAASEEEMEKILQLVKGLVDDDGTSGQGTISVSKKAVLACLTIASRYLSLQKDYENFRKDNEARSLVLNEQIGARLRAEK